MDPQIKFVSNAYLEAFRASTGLSTDKEIFQHVRHKLLFHYGKVSPEQFNEKYSASGWVTRKVFALPMACWSGIIQTIHHVAKAVFGLTDRTYFKAQLFHIARDLQEAYGHLRSLFNDRKGQFHVQESRFHQDCYLYAAYPRIATIEEMMGCVKLKGDGLSGYHSGYGGNVDSSAHKITLLNYRNYPEIERLELIQAFHLEVIITNLGGLGISLDDFIQNTDPKILQALTFEDLTIPLKASKMRFALMSDEEFTTLTLRQLSAWQSLEAQDGKEITGINNTQLRFIQERLWQFSEPSQDHPHGEAILPQLQDLSLKQLMQLQAQSLPEDPKQIPELAFALLKHEQLQGLKLSSLESTQITALFRGLNEREARLRFALFDDQEIVDAVNSKRFLDSNLEVHLFDSKSIHSTFELLTSSQLKKIEFSSLSYDEITHIFETRRQDPAFKKERFALLPIGALQNLLERGHFYSKKDCFSSAHWQGIDFSKLSQETINHLFPPCSLEEVTERHSTWVTQFSSDGPKTVWKPCMVGDLKQIAARLKTENEQHLALLSDAQKKQLLPRLYQMDPKEANRKEETKPKTEGAEDFATFFNSFFANKTVGPASFDPSQKKRTDLSEETLAAYKTLELTPSASLDEIKKAYRTLALEHHPDKVVQQPDEDAATFEKRKQTSAEKFTAFTKACKLLIEGA